MAQDEFEITVEDRPGVGIVAVAGEVDLATAPAIESTLAAVVAPAVVVDLRGVTFMDSSGLRAVIDGYRSAVARHASFAVVASSDGAVARLFELAMVDTIMTVVDTVEAALEGAQAGPVGGPS